MAEEELVYTEAEMDPATQKIAEALNRAEVPGDILHAVAMTLVGLRRLQDIGLKDSDAIALVEAMLTGRPASGPN